VWSVAAGVAKHTVETASAIIAGGDVVSTISKAIIDPAKVVESATFVWAMMAALFSCAAFAAHLALKGLKKIWKVDVYTLGPCLPRRCSTSSPT
jgi:phosphate/sulfate permease